MHSAAIHNLRGTTHGVVTLPALDVRARPEHRAELLSQLLMGETVRLLAPARSGWLRVRGDLDAYEGWVRQWGLVLASAARVRRWQAAATSRVSATFLTMEGGTGVVGPLFFGSRVIAGPRRRGRRLVELPDGRRGSVPAEGLAGRKDPAPGLFERINSLLGTPYLWGGRTPAGIDCSAFVQLVYAERGIALPRDARDQHRACLPLARDEKDLPGDLIFFAAPGEPVGHVGIGMGDGWFAHSRGRVQLASLDPRNPLCDKALMPQSRGWFRVPRSPRGRERRPRS